MHPDMKSFFFSMILFALATFVAKADSDDPVLMRINGEPVYRSEFEYSYNKNGNLAGAVEQKSVEEYADMFVNYKLKVLAARAAHLDTLESFQKEYAHYRDLQLLPSLVDSAYIDSVAYSLYERTAQQLKGQDMLRVAHIMLTVKQGATDEERESVRLRCDSIYKAIMNGADFMEMAKRFSQDKATARSGGILPWLGPGMAIREIEQAAYAMQPGQVSEPISSALGFHLIKMLERKQLAPYDSLRKSILESLYRQGIAEASAEHRISKLLARYGNRLTREALLDSVYVRLLARQPDLKYLIQEYHDGLLLYEISQRTVWDKAKNDGEGLERFFKANKKNYQWDGPRFRGYIVHSKDPKLVKKAAKILKKEDNWRTAIHREFNRDSVMVTVQGPFLAKQGENPYIDARAFGGTEPSPREGFPYFELVGKKLKRPETYADVKSHVENDYRKVLEDQWVAELRKQYSVEINSAVLQTVNRH